LAVQTDGSGKVHEGAGWSACDLIDLDLMAKDYYCIF
jgi:hypothetical protein